MLGLMINSKLTPSMDSTSTITDGDVRQHQVYFQQQRQDSYAHSLEHAAKRKAAFDKTLLAKHPGEVIFEAGQLVQVYCTDLTYTFKSIRKLLPRWSPPRRVVSRDRNSYQLETTAGVPLESTFSSRRLCRFIPREGTLLARSQAENEARMKITAPTEEERGRAEEAEPREEEGIEGSDGDLRLDVGDGLEGGDLPWREGV